MRDSTVLSGLDDKIIFKIHAKYTPPNVDDAPHDAANAAANPKAVVEAVPQSPANGGHREGGAAATAAQRGHPFCPRLNLTLVASPAGHFRETT